MYSYKRTQTLTCLVSTTTSTMYAFISNPTREMIASGSPSPSGSIFQSPFVVYYVFSVGGGGGVLPARDGWLVGIWFMVVYR